jgi:hypothetical protein
LRLLLACSLAFASALVAAPNSCAAASTTQRVAASVWPGKPYFVANKVAMKKQPAFIVDSKSKFDSIFRYGAYMGAPPPLDMAIFSTKTLLGIAEESPSICTSTLVSVTRTGSDYTVRYTQKCPPPSSARYVVPFVVFVPKAPITSVAFVRNGSVRARIKR